MKTKNQKQVVDLIPINWIIFTFIWSIISLLFAIPFDSIITTLIIFTILFKIDFGKIYELESCKVGIPLVGCTWGLILYHLFESIQIFIGNDFVERHVNLGATHSLLILSLLVPPIGSFILAWDAYIQSDMNKFNGPIIKCVNKFESKQITVDSPDESLSVYCRCFSVLALPIFIIGFFVMLMLKISIFLAILSLMSILINSKHMSIDKIIALWDKPREDLQLGVTPKNPKSILLKAYSWSAFFPLIALSFFVFTKNNQLIFICIPTIIYFLIYSMRMFKRFEYIDKKRFKLPLGNIYFFISCILIFNILIIREIIIIEPIFTQFNLNSFQLFILSHGYNIAFLNSIIAIILFSMEYFNKFRNIYNSSPPRDEYQIVILPLLGTLFLAYLLTPLFSASYAHSNLIFLIVVLCWAFLICYAVFLSFYEFKKK